MTHRFQSAFFLFIVACMLPLTALVAQDNAPAKAKSIENPFEIPSASDVPAIPGLDKESQFASDFIKMLSTLGLLTALLLFVSWYLKRLTKTRVQQLNTSSAIKIIEQRQLSARSTIYLIELDGKSFAIGESSGNICMLGELPSQASTQ